MLLSYHKRKKWALPVRADERLSLEQNVRAEGFFVMRFLCNAFSVIGFGLDDDLG
jgi:hypothetical protein